MQKSLKRDPKRDLKGRPDGVKMAPEIMLLSEGGLLAPTGSLQGAQDAPKAQK